MIYTKDDRIEGLVEGEMMLYRVRRHWFGLMIVYVEVGIGFAAAALLLYFLAPIMYPNADIARRNFNLSILISVAAITTWLILVLYTYIYRQSMLIITNKNLTQIIQRGLFSRKVSELSMANVEDVTADQHGFFATTFNYGTLQVETAGEADNFDFVLCPNPNFYGKIVLDARQKYVDAHPGNARR